jgi:hypothetical protein
VKRNPGGERVAGRCQLDHATPPPGSRWGNPGKFIPCRHALKRPALGAPCWPRSGGSPPGECPSLANLRPPAASIRMSAVAYENGHSLIHRLALLRHLPLDLLHGRQNALPYPKRSLCLRLIRSPSTDRVGCALPSCSSTESRIETFTTAAPSPPLPAHPRPSHPAGL